MTEEIYEYTHRETVTTTSPMHSSYPYPSSGSPYASGAPYGASQYSQYGSRSPSQYSQFGGRYEPPPRSLSPPADLSREYRRHGHGNGYGYGGHLPSDYHRSATPPPLEDDLDLYRRPLASQRPYDEEYYRGGMMDAPRTSFWQSPDGSETVFESHSVSNDREEHVVEHTRRSPSPHFAPPASGYSPMSHSMHPIDEFRRPSYRPGQQYSPSRSEFRDEFANSRGGYGSGFGGMDRRSELPYDSPRSGQDFGRRSGYQSHHRRSPSPHSHHQQHHGRVSPYRRDEYPAGQSSPYYNTHSRYQESPTPVEEEVEEYTRTTTTTYYS